MKKFLQFLLKERSGLNIEARKGKSYFDLDFKLTYFEMILLPLLITISIFIGNALIVVPGAILIFVLNIILKHLTEEDIEIH